MNQHSWFMLLLFTVFALSAEGALSDREYLMRAACHRNPGLSMCRKEKDVLLVEPPAIPDVPQKDHGRPPRTLRAHDDLAELNKRILEQTKEGPADEEIRAKCLRIAPIAQKHCEKSALTKANVRRCASYFKDCYRYFEKADPLYSIANAFSSAVNINFAVVDVNGIPYYPVNEEGGVGVAVQANIPFGSWGGGYSDHVGVRDYWSQNQEVGANWYEGKYGYKNHWSVPLVQSLGIEGGQHNTASVPLTKKDLGKIMVDNGYGVGGYYGHNDHVGVDWKKGDVVHNFGVASPFAGAGFNTGQAVTFPSLETFMNAGKK